MFLSQRLVRIVLEADFRGCLVEV